MGSIVSTFKDMVDPANLEHNKGQSFANPTSVLKQAHAVLDPAGALTGNLIQKHNNTQNNVRGTFDPAQWFGPNATQAPGPNPYAPGSIMNLRGGHPGIGQGMNQNGAPSNGISTNGLQPAQAQSQSIGQPVNAFNPQGGTPNFGIPPPQPQMPGVPANGISTNGLPTTPNWSAIIANALRK